MQRASRVSLTTWLLVAMVLGILVGWAVGPPIGSIKFIGDIFLRLVQMVVVFLVLGCMIQAIGGIDPRGLGRMGVKVVAFYIGTTVLAVICAIIMANLFQPGVGVPKPEGSTAPGQPQEVSWVSVIVNMFPRNPVDAMARMDMFQVIVFGIFVGIALGLLGERGKRIYELVCDFNEVMIRIVNMVMWFAPVGIFALMAWVTGTVGLAVLIPMAKFLLALLCAVALTLIVVVGGTVRIAGLSIVQFFRKASRMMVVAFTTCSSAVTLPVQMQDAEEKLGIGSKTARFALPLGAIINNDGLSMYLVVASILIAQFFGVELSVVHQLKLALLATLISLGGTAIPGGALINITLVLPAMGLPLEGVALVAGVDRLADMLRTILNVVDDVSCALLVAVTEGDFHRDVFMR